MKNPNGYGGVSKLPGNRRRPWRARVTVRMEGGKQIYQTIGYYPTREDALIALAEYNKHPTILGPQTTFAQVYEQWSDRKFATVSDSSIKIYKAVYKLCEPIYSMPFASLRLAHLQHVVDTCSRNYPTLSKLRGLFSQLYDFAMKHDVCQKDYSQYVEIAQYKQKNAAPKHSRFAADEIDRLWQRADQDADAAVVLMLIYSGVRVSELLDLKKEDVHLDERYFSVTHSKTEAGVRVVPIAAKTLPFFRQRMELGGEYLLSDDTADHLAYTPYFRHHWAPLMDRLDLSHLPHDTRHTAISLLAEKNVNPTIIKRIAGHTGAMSLTERVYTHFEVKELIAAIDLI